MLLLPATLTAAEAQDVLHLARQAVARESGELLGVDASPLARFDSTALAVLLETRRLARAWGKGCRVQGLPPALGELARLYGVAALLELGGPEPAAPPSPDAVQPADAEGPVAPAMDAQPAADLSTAPVAP